MQSTTHRRRVGTLRFSNRTDNTSLRPILKRECADRNSNSNTNTFSNNVSTDTKIVVFAHSATTINTPTTITTATTVQESIHSEDINDGINDIENTPPSVHLETSILSSDAVFSPIISITAVTKLEDTLPLIDAVTLPPEPAQDDTKHVNSLYNDQIQHIDATIRQLKRQRRFLTHSKHRAVLNALIERFHRHNR